jgi:4-nitrophenyl phosphatase
MKRRLFLDLDGTVYVDSKIVDAVDAELRRLASDGTHIHYLTNNTSMSSRQYTQKLAGLNLPLHESAVISPTIVLADWLRNHGVSRVFSVGTKAFIDELHTRAGVEQTGTRPDCVVVAFDRELTYQKLQIASGLINSGVPWFLTHIDLACPSAEGPIPDCGSIGKLLEATTGIPPVGHFGKPGDLMLCYLRGLIEPGEDVIVAGDRLYTDAAIGLELGVRTVLVCSGEFQQGTSTLDPRIEVHETLAKFLREYGV